MPHHPTASACVASVDEIRASFPALGRVHNGLPVAYFDGPGGTQTPRCVVDAIADYLYCHNANTHWNFPTSAETDKMLHELRTALADFLARHRRRLCWAPMPRRWHFTRRAPGAHV